ncbi:unnamed protein product, partial [Mesorhabditis belari]|uniref:Uncharacterized protein n=1 Tax=Mesorhabditis belari TaxID=2138241 RepID=A0AAF3FG29_9BILA
MEIGQKLKCSTCEGDDAELLHSMSKLFICEAHGHVADQEKMLAKAICSHCAFVQHKNCPGVAQTVLEKLGGVQATKILKEATPHIEEITKCAKESVKLIESVKAGFFQQNINLIQSRQPTEIETLLDAHLKSGMKIEVIAEKFKELNNVIKTLVDELPRSKLSPQRQNNSPPPSRPRSPPPSYQESSRSSPSLSDHTRLHQFVNPRHNYANQLQQEIVFSDLSHTPINDSYRCSARIRNLSDHVNVRIIVDPKNCTCDKEFWILKPNNHFDLVFFVTFEELKKNGEVELLVHLDGKRKKGVPEVTKKISFSPEEGVKVAEK